MKKQFVNTLSIVLLAAASSVALGGPSGDHPDGSSHDGKSRMHRGAMHERGMHENGDPARMVKHLTRKLDLDELQQQQIQNIVTAVRPEMEALKVRAEANRTAMRELDARDSNYDARLADLASEKGAIASEQAMLHGRLKSDIGAVLTPEQKQELASQAGKMRDRFQKRKEGRSRS